MKYLALVTAFAMVSAAGTAALADSPVTESESAASVQPEVVATDHHVTYMFQLEGGASKTIELPVIGTPVRLMAACGPGNGGTQTPSELVSAVISQDPLSAQLTWIGTNADGSQQAGNTIGSPIIAQFAFSQQSLSGSAGASPTAKGHLTFTDNIGSASRKQKFYVTLDY